MVGIYILVFLLNGVYALPTKFRNIIQGAFSGSLVVLITYSLLDEEYRFSRAVVLFSVLWTLFIIPAYRLLLSALKLNIIERNLENRIAIVGKADELKRIDSLIKNTILQPQLICYISSDNQEETNFNYTGKLYQLEDIIDIYNLNEVIFCSKDVSSEEIIKQMAALSQKDVDFKIAPPESLYIIGSNSKQHAGEYYVISSDAILKPINQRNKRLLDISLAILLTLLSPILVWFNPSFKLYFKNLFLILSGKLSFVGFSRVSNLKDHQLRLKRGILTPSDQFKGIQLDDKSQEQLNFEYSREYNLGKDLEIIFKNLTKLGNS